MKYRVFIRGENFLVRLKSNKPSKHGFYVTAHLEARSKVKAGELALEFLRADEGLRDVVKNLLEDRPRLLVEEISPVDVWPVDVARPLTGLAWFEEEKEEPNQAPEPTAPSGRGSS